MGARSCRAHRRRRAAPREPLTTSRRPKEHPHRTADPVNASPSPGASRRRPRGSAARRAKGEGGEREPWTHLGHVGAAGVQHVEDLRGKGVADISMALSNRTLA